ITVAGFGAGAVDDTDTLYSIEKLQFSDGTATIYQLGLDDYSADLVAPGYLKPPANSLSSSPLPMSSTGRIDYLGDHDRFVVYLPAGNTYVVDLRGASSSGGTLADPYLRVIAGNGQSVGDAHDSGVGHDDQLAIHASYTGAYYVDASALYGTGSYTVSA